MCNKATTHDDNEVVRDRDRSAFNGFENADEGRGDEGTGACASTLDRDEGPAEGLTLILLKYREGAGDGSRGLGSRPDTSLIQN